MWLPETKTVSTSVNQDGIVAGGQLTCRRNWAASHQSGREVYQSPWVSRNDKDVPAKRAGNLQVARPWTNEELDADGVNRDFATAAFRTALSLPTRPRPSWNCTSGLPEWRAE
jgi:hypothetical protein